MSFTHLRSVWPTLDEFGSLWMSLAHLRSVWPTLDEFGSLWMSLAHLRSVWPTLDQDWILSEHGAWVPTKTCKYGVNYLLATLLPSTLWIYKHQQWICVVHWSYLKRALTLKYTIIVLVTDDQTRMYLPLSERLQGSDILSYHNSNMCL